MQNKVFTDLNTDRIKLYKVKYCNIIIVVVWKHLENSMDFDLNCLATPRKFNGFLFELFGMCCIL